MTNTPQDVETAAEQIKQVNDRVVEIARKVALLWIDGVEKAVEGFVAFERKLADQGPAEPVGALFKTQADVTHELTRGWAKLAREVVAA